MKSPGWFDEYLLAIVKYVYLKTVRKMAYRNSKMKYNSITI